MRIPGIYMIDYSLSDFTIEVLDSNPASLACKVSGKFATVKPIEVFSCEIEDQETDYGSEQNFSSSFESEDFIPLLSLLAVRLFFVDGSIRVVHSLNDVPIALIRQESSGSVKDAKVFSYELKLKDAPCVFDLIE